MATLLHQPRWVDARRIGNEMALSITKSILKRTEKIVVATSLVFVLVAVVIAMFRAKHIVKRAGLICQSPAFSFGKVAPSILVQHDFKIRNTGPRSIEIQSIRTGCFCTK